MASAQVTVRNVPGATSDIEMVLSALIDITVPIAGTYGQVLTSGGPGGGIFWSDPGVSLTPSFSAFGISGQSTPLEVGTQIASGDKTFTWSTVNPSVIQANSISIVDTTASSTLASGLANDGSEVINFASPITNSSPATHVWTINGTSTAMATFSKTYTVTWLWRVYAGTSANVTLNAGQIKALSDSSGLQANFPGTYNFSAGGYKYFCFPDSMGDPINFFSGAFLVSMATASDNAAYSNVGANGWAYALVSVLNAQSVATNYRVYRSQFVLGGTQTWAVS